MNSILNISKINKTKSINRISEFKPLNLYRESNENRDYKLNVLSRDEFFDNIIKIYAKTALYYCAKANNVANIKINNRNNRQTLIETISLNKFNIFKKCLNSFIKNNKKSLYEISIKN